MSEELARLSLRGICGSGAIVVTQQNHQGNSICRWATEIVRGMQIIACEELCNQKNCKCIHLLDLSAAKR